MYNRIGLVYNICCDVSCPSFVRNSFKGKPKYCLLPFACYLLIPFIFLSCRMGKEYQRPALELPKQFNSVSFSDTSSIADLEWKKFFTDTTLQSFNRKGITYNHDLLIAIKRIEIAQQQVKQANLLQLPEHGSSNNRPV